MMTFVLILFFHVGPMSDGNSNATTSVPGFISLQECQTAGQQAKTLTSGTLKQTNFVCVVQSIRK